MNNQKKKLMLNRETLRDLTAHNAGGVKGGKKGNRGENTKKGCATAGCLDTVAQCPPLTEYCW